MALILAISAAADVPAWVFATQTVILAAVALFLLTRPAPPQVVRTKEP